MEYDIIYADPPWRYDDNTVPPNRRIENHYPTMALEDIKTWVSHRLRIVSYIYGLLPL